MPRNNGIYTPPNGTWTTAAVTGSLATLSDWQALINDLTNALTQSVSKDGQTPMTGSLPMNGNKLTGLGAGVNAGDSLRWQQLFDQGTEADIASAATTDIGAQNSNFLRVTGTTTITSFGTNYRGPRFLRFAGAVTLTNSSALVLPGGVNFTTAIGDILIAIPKATSGTADGWAITALPALPLTGGTLSGALAMSDQQLSQAMLRDTGYTYFNSGTTNALNYVNGSHQRWAPATGAQTLSITNWPPTGNLGELLIEGINLGASTITWPTINWIKFDGTTTTTFSGNGVTLQTSGTDWILLWTRDAGTTIFGKVVR